MNDRRGREFVGDVIIRIKTKRTSRNVQYVSDWRERIPQWSRWTPGCPGLPDCETCKGLGYVRLDLPIGHPDQGKLFLCDCSRSNPLVAQI